MLELTSKGIFSPSYTLRTPQFELLEIKASGWRERAEFQLQGHRYRLSREGAMSGDFVLERDGAVIARATKPSAFRDTFELDPGGRTFALRRRSIWKSEFLVFSGDEQVGSIRRAGVWSRRALVDLPDDWPLPFQLFVFWLTMLMWRRGESAAVASGG